MMIDSKDISVVVQGAVGSETARCLRSIRHYLPDAEIILSTWVGTDVSGLDYDKLVVSDDPGGITKDPLYPSNNVNRQLISTQAGLKEATRKYTLKLRTDLVIKSVNFLKYFDAFPKRNAKYSIFKHRVIISTVFSRERYANYNFLFHPSDFWFFGLTTDVCDYWIGTKIHDGKNANPKKLTKWAFAPDTNNLVTYVPEQYYCINWVHRHFPDIVFDDYSDDNPDAIVASKNILYNNFIFIGPYQSGIWSKKHRKNYHNEYSDKPDFKGLITYELFQQRYKELCDKNYVPIRDRYRYLYKLRSNIKFVLTPFDYIIKYLIRIMRLLYYLGMFILSFFRKNRG